MLAGYDANCSPMALVPHGENIHYELELLMEAGLTNIEALRAAISLPSRYFSPEDRRVFEVGKKADLVLVNGNSVEDLQVKSLVKRIWFGSVKVSLAK